MQFIRHRIEYLVVLLKTTNNHIYIISTKAKPSLADISSLMFNHKTILRSYVTINIIKKLLFFIFDIISKLDLNK